VENVLAYICTAGKGSVCDYTFAVALNDQQKQVYSALLGELLIRCCSECENAGKSLLSIHQGNNPSDFNMPRVITELNNLMQIEQKKLEIIWPYQTLQDINIIPFKRENSNDNPEWFYGYNKLKHNRENHQDKGNLWNVVVALGGR